jgi:mannose-6-phosphate isomerase-like protein (cupin superfamily)
MKALAIFLLGLTFQTQTPSTKNISSYVFDHNGKSVQTFRLFDDSLSSSFLIFVKDSVSEHYHLSHAEQVFILEGVAMMKLGDQNFEVKPGDIIYIPKGKSHSVRVNSLTPLKLISIQAPYFDGKDRVFLKEY